MSSTLFGADRSAERIPVSLITGFLGSGKTTLLNRLLRDPGMADSAVIINELGEIGLDHLLVERVDGETVLLQSGCICCTVRSDLETTLRGMLGKVRRGELRPFGRVLVETTGIADPAPICQLLLNNPMLTHWFRLDAVVTTVDALHGPRQLDREVEARMQAALADRLLVTKSDLAAPSEVERLEARLAALNPAALRYRPVLGEIAPDRLFGTWAFDTARKTIDGRRWLGAEPPTEGEADGHAHHHHAHDHLGSDIRTTALRFDTPLPWPRVARWLDLLRARHADRLLRLKGILSLEGERGPVVVHGVHDVFHPPVLLGAWPDDDHGSRLVIIGRELDRAMVEQAWSDSAAMAGPAAG